MFVPKAVPAAGPDGTLPAGGGTLLDALDLPTDGGVPCNIAQEKFAHGVFSDKMIKCTLFC